MEVAIVGLAFAAVVWDLGVRHIKSREPMERPGLLDSVSGLRAEVASLQADVSSLRDQGVKLNNKLTGFEMTHRSSRRG